MARATSTSPEEEKVKKAPRKRAASTRSTVAKKSTPRKTTTRKTPAKKTPRKATTRKAPEEKIKDDVAPVEDDVSVEEPETDTTPMRKAPTKFAKAKATHKTKRNHYVVIGLLILLGVGSSAAVGFSDSEAGQINVAQTIQERNERMANLVDVTGPTVVVPTPSQVPDGGLIGLRPADPAANTDNQPATASTTATSSDATASSTVATSTGSSTLPAVDLPRDQFATDTATTSVEATEASTSSESTDTI